MISWIKILTMKILTWNIGGIDGYEPDVRCHHICHMINNLNPDIVLFQELTLDFCKIIKTKCQKYNLVFPTTSSANYFVGTLLKKSYHYESFYLPFENSVMGRGLLSIKIDDILIFNSHLESLAQFKLDRMKQLEQICQLMTQFKTIIFGGDTNIRVNEYKTILKKFPEIKDIFQNKKYYTWDAKTNKQVADMTSGGSYTCRMQFDKILYKGFFQPKNIELIGTKTIPNKNFHPSDHFGVACEF